MGKTLIRIGPDDHGQRMTLGEFESAETSDGRLYELGRGTIVMVDVPNRRHLAQADAARQQLYDYRKVQPGRIHRVATGGECKILLADLESERHPDLAIYKTAPPAEEGAEGWATWIPEVVIEITSARSAQRDYQEKPEEYLQFGVGEYWVLDADRGEAGEMTVFRRRAGKWAQRVVKAGKKYKTRLLPGFEFDVAAVFGAAGR